MIEYFIKIHLNKEIKAKVNYYFSLEFTEFIRLYLNIFEWKARSCDKVTWSVLSQQPSSHISQVYILDEVFIWASGPSRTLY